MTALLLLSLLATAPASVSAAPDDEAARLRALFADGQRLFSERRFSEAASRFERLYELKPHPSVLFNLARCYEKLQETPRALRFYRDYIHQAPDAPDRPQVVESIQALESRLRKRGVSQLMVFTEPPGARVEVDGKYLGESPASAELLPGPHELTVSAEGFVRETRIVPVVLGVSPEASVSLVRGAPAPIVQVERLPEPVAPALPSAPPDAVPAAQVARQAEEASASAPVAPWLAAGGAVAGAAVGAGFTWMAWDTAETYRATRDFDRRPTLKADMERDLVIANGAFVAAGVAAVTAAVLFVLSR